MYLKKYKKIFREYFSQSKIIILGFGILAIFLVINLTKEIINRHQIDQKIKKYQEDIIKLERENFEVSGLISSWKNGGQLEKEARLKLGLQKPGENAVLILRDDRLNNTSTVDPNSEIVGNLVIAGKDNVSNSQKWIIYFFKK